MKPELQNKLYDLVVCFEHRLRLARATELASCARLLEAESLLAPGGMLPKSAEELDLLARIHVKQGRFDLAKRRWQDALETGGRTAEFQECLSVLEKHRQRVFRWRYCLRIGALLVLGAVILFGVYLLLRPVGGDSA